MPGATSYFYELAENDNTFGTVLYSSTVTSNFVVLPANFSFMEGKTYSWRVTAINGCGSSAASASEDFQWILVGVNEIAERELIVYPNPAESEVFIQNFQPGKSLVTIFNSTGQLVLTSTFNQPGVHTLSVGDLSSGIYTIQVGRITKRLLIK
jgi:hypothetical protein